MATIGIVALVFIDDGGEDWSSQIDSEVQRDMLLFRVSWIQQTADTSAVGVLEQAASN